MSQWHLSKHLDQTFYGLLNSVRAKRAKAVLNAPGLHFSRISELLGYETPPTSP